MKKTAFISIVLMFVVCGVLHAETIGNTDKEVKLVAEPLLDNIMKAIETNNYKKYTRDMDDHMKELLPEDKFLVTNQQIRNSIGNCKSRKYLGFLNKGSMTVILWKGSFSKSEDDVLIKLVVSKRGDKYFITGLWFQ